MFVIFHNGSLKSDNATTRGTIAATAAAAITNSHHHLTLFQFFYLQIHRQKQRGLLLRYALLQPCEIRVLM
jgi:hypothetical protein